MSIGSYYYPEQWPHENRARDIKKMAEVGFQFTHYGEFAWTFIEPEEGKFDFKWLDEVIVHQDAVVCKGLYAYMREIAQRQNILIFLVDHNPVAANYCDYLLTVKKEGNVKDCYSTVEWRS